MAKGRLENIFSLDGAEQGQQLADALPPPTLEERVNFYLNAVHGPREFTSNDRSKARDIILGTMASGVAEQTGSSRQSEPLSPALGSREDYESLTPSFEAMYGARGGMAVPSARPLLAASYEGVEWDLRERPSSALRAQLQALHKPRRFGKRTVAAFSIMAAVVVLAIPALLSTGWFSGQPSSSKTTSVASELGQEKRQASSLMNPREMSDVAAPRNPSDSSKTLTLATPQGINPSVSGKPLAPISPLQTANVAPPALENLLTSGDLPRARSMLADAANRGDATAALTLGATYDPIEIERLGRRDVTPDVSSARNWYQKASDLGSTEAQARLQRLSQRFPAPDRNSR